MIFKLKPNRVRRTYKGGVNIDKFENEQFLFCGMEYYPEDWTASITSANNFPLFENEGIGITEDGKYLTEIISGNFPILVKLLDSAERLVIQAHPTVEFAQKYLGSNFGKTECWYFLDCSDDACVYLGFKEGISFLEWERAFDEQNSEKMLGMLHKISVKNGDFIFVDGGIPHAIGAGCFMIELQEPTDYMVVAEKRTPSGRKIPENKIDMGLGRKCMFELFDYSGFSYSEIMQRFAPKPREVAPKIYEILGKSLTDKFSMYRLTLQGKFVPGKRYVIAVVCGGEGMLCGVWVKRGDRLLIDDEQTITFYGNRLFEVIVCF